MATDLTKAGTKELHDEIARRKRVRPVPIIVPAFGPLFRMITEEVDKMADTGKPHDDDFEHYCYEEAMKAVYGKDIFTWINKHVDSCR
jgi:hypothetical protein